MHCVSLTIKQDTNIISWRRPSPPMVVLRRRRRYRRVVVATWRHDKGKLGMSGAAVRMMVGTKCADEGATGGFGALKMKRNYGSLEECYDTGPVLSGSCSLDSERAKTRGWGDGPPQSTSGQTLLLVLVFTTRCSLSNPSTKTTTASPPNCFSSPSMFAESYSLHTGLLLLPRHLSGGTRLP